MRATSDEKPGLLPGSWMGVLAGVTCRAIIVVAPESCQLSETSAVDGGDVYVGDAGHMRSVPPPMRERDPDALCRVCAMPLIASGPAGNVQGLVEGTKSDPPVYTCPMHPSVRVANSKAQCPICSMDLVPESGEPHHENELEDRQ